MLQAEPTQARWSLLKRILRYLKHTANLGIKFEKNNNGLTEYSDSDYANDKETRRSVSGTLVMYNGPILWRSQRQPIVALSSTEAEYISGCDLVKDLIPIKKLLQELNRINADPIPVYIDNQSTIKIATNHTARHATKHIEVRQRWLSEQQESKAIDIKHVSGQEQPADIFTKPLTKSIQRKPQHSDVSTTIEYGPNSDGIPVICTCSSKSGFLRTNRNLLCQSIQEI